MSYEHEKTLVIPDLHGRPELLRASFQAYPHAEHFIIAGDFIDGRDTKGVLDILADQNPERVTVLLGNHEWVLDAALHEEDPEARDVWTEVWRQPYHDRVLRSYGLPGAPHIETADALREILPPDHAAVLRDAALYHRAADYVVLHAGITGEPLPAQFAYLDAMNLARRSGNFNGEIPMQLAGKDRQSGERVLLPDDALAVLDDAGVERMINGHWHRSRHDAPMRAAGRVVYLALNPQYDELPVYETWSNEITIVTPP